MAKDAKRLKVPKYAKEAAKRALEFNKEVPKSQKVGLTKIEAKKKGINSGVERAKQLIKSDSISMEDARAVCNFKRFLGMKQTTRVEAAIDLWGGERFIRDACEFVKKNDKRK